MSNLREKIIRILEHQHDRNFCKKELESLFQQEFKRMVKEAKPNVNDVLYRTYASSEERRVAISEYEQSLLKKVEEV